MRAWTAMVRREIHAWLCSPIGYVVMACYSAMTGWQLIDALREAEGSYTQFESLVATMAARWLPLVVAGVTMRMFSRARADGSLEVLLSAPVSDGAIVSAKFAAAWLLVMLAALGNVVPVGVILSLSPAWPGIDPGCMVGAFIGMGLLVSLWCSLGLLLSLMTRDQGVACVATLVVVGLPVVAGSGSVLLPSVAVRAQPFHPIYTHLADMSSGLLTVGATVIYAGGCATVLFICVRLLESLRWK